jgi:DNA gyrase subunit A
MKDFLLAVILVPILAIQISALGFAPKHVSSSWKKQLNYALRFSSSSSSSNEYLDDDNDDIDDDIPKSTQDFISEADVAAQANVLASVSQGTSGEIEIQTEIEQSFLQYALSIILGRALPDARDGLKPVHRRILFAMNELKLDHASPHRKCARIVGEVLGKFHPHGDMAVYDALVRMAQDFSTNMPLIDGHGNFGSIDADPAAAMRYTECRLTNIAQEGLLQDLYDDTVDFISNFDGNEVEPIVLPAKLPILLLNGCSGIAVGMATNVPPHNLKELLAACNSLLESRRPGASPLTDEELFQLVPAPDFPTGATILGTSGARQLYSTGNGGIILRAETTMETIRVGKSQQTRTAIIVTSLPYQVNKSLLLEKIADLVNDKKLEGIADLRDESDRDGIRVVIELKRDAVAAVVLNNLYKKTPLQTSFSGNFLALMGEGTKPQRFTLRSALECFLDFRFETLRRRSAFVLRKVENRAEIVEGLLKALDSIDQVIDIIRTSSDQNSARNMLMNGNNVVALALTREQADAVLRLQLGQLTRLNKDKLESELNDLMKTKGDLKKLLTEDQAVRDLMMKENNQMSNQFGVDRRSKIQFDDIDEISEKDMIKNSRSVVLVTRSGYIKRLPLAEFESQNRGTRGKRGISDQGSAGNEIAHCFTCNDHDTLLMVTQRGIAYGLRAYQVPTASRTARGTPIPAVLPVKSDDTINSILPVSEFSEDEYIVLTTEQGWIKKTPLAAFDKLTSRGLTIATLENDDKLLSSLLCKDGDDILIGTKLGMATRFEASKLRPTGRTSRGVRAMRLRDGDAVADMNVLNGSSANIIKSGTQEYVLTLTSRGFGKRVPTKEFRAQARGGVGVVAIKFKDVKTGGQDAVTCLRTVKDDDEILVITAKGVIVRQQVKNISSQGRTATGVLIQKLDPGDHITSVSLVPKYEESDVTLSLT